MWTWMLVPACLRCRHYQSYLPSRKYDDLAKCRKWNTTQYAMNVRANELKCGTQGIWYEPTPSN